MAKVGAFESEEVSCAVSSTEHTAQAMELVVNPDGTSTHIVCVRDRGQGDRACTGLGALGAVVLDVAKTGRGARRQDYSASGSRALARSSRWGCAAWSAARPRLISSASFSAVFVPT